MQILKKEASASFFLLMCHWVRQWSGLVGLRRRWTKKLWVYLYLCIGLVWTVLEAN
ncbi:hypothetical protein HMPREF9371_0316 [Neisseria shayeganii 871]|uniref:Uncharacterized protein n=1 Tax=Neisseria shayeganii 871 TaxID=1032488 RepID=G4CFC7_9NEIS|nr:hypothetical protein HMPREF9371_0316 [Neisseria shayeganii 871]